MSKVYSCFKCKEHLTGVCAALEIGGEWTLCLSCLYGFATIFGSDETSYLTKGGWWTLHCRKKRGDLFYTYPRTMLETGRFRDKNGRETDRTRYCSDCKKDCGLGQRDLILFYCGRAHYLKSNDLLTMQCDTCFTKEVGMWYVSHASTSDGGIVNREASSVRLYSSPTVIQHDIWDY